MNRRALFPLFSLAIPAWLLACAQTGAQPVTLDQVKQWAQELTDAISAVVSLDVVPSPTIPPAVKAQVSTGLTLLQTANGALQQVQVTAAPTTPQPVVADIIQAVETLMPLLAPLVPEMAPTGPIGMAITMAVMVLAAFLHATPIVTPVVPAALHRAALRYRGRR